MQSSLVEPCPLCGQQGNPFYKKAFYACINCSGIFRPVRDYPDLENEKRRYLTHQNDTGDPGYRQFALPLVQAVQQFHPLEDSGLDFGAGTGPVVSRLLEEAGYNIVQFDPFFVNDRVLLQNKYEYIICCEVIEHFHYPGREFELLKNMLQPGGSLFCMTAVYEPEISFDDWSYKNDFTHVFIYQQFTLRWISQAFGFASVSINDRVIQFTTT